MFILSEDFEDKEYKGVPVFNNSKELLERVKKLVCENPTDKVLVFVNPAFLKAPEVVVPIDSIIIEEEVVKEGNKEPKPIDKPLPPVNCQQVTANNIDEFLSMLSTTSIDDCRKENISKSHNKFFASNAQVVEVDNNVTPIETFQSVTAFVSRIRGKNKIIKIDHANCVKDGNKYLKLSVRMP